MEYGASLSAGDAIIPAYCLPAGPRDYCRRKAYVPLSESNNEIIGDGIATYEGYRDRGNVHPSNKGQTSGNWMNHTDNMTFRYCSYIISGLDDNDQTS